MEPVWRTRLSIQAASELSLRPTTTRHEFGTSGTDLLDFAHSVVPRKLTLCERKRFFLPLEGRSWGLPELTRASIIIPFGDMRRYNLRGANVCLGSGIGIGGSL